MRARHVTRTALMALMALLAACSMQDMANRMTPKGDMPLVKTLFAKARQGDITAEKALFARNAAPDPRSLRRLHAALAAGATPELRYVHVSMQSGASTRTLLKYRLASRQHAYEVDLGIGGPEGRRSLQWVAVGQPADLFRALPGLRHVLEVAGLAALALLAGMAGLVTWLVRRSRASGKG